MDISLLELLGTLFGLIRGIAVLCAALWASAELITAVWGRLRGLDPKNRYWRKVKNLSSNALYCLILGGLGCILGGSYPDLLGFSLTTSAGLFILAVIINFLAYMLIPKEPKPAPGEAGASTWAMARRRRLIAMVMLLGVGSFMIAASIFLVENKILAGGTLLIMLLLLRFGLDFLDALSRKMEKEARRAERGAVAEERVGQVLEELGEDVFVLHDIESPYGNIDHLAITREGKIFVIETKSHRGKVSASENKLLLNGHPMEKDPISQVLRNLFWLKSKLREAMELEPRINGLVVFSRAFVPEPLTVRGVQVVNIRDLERVLRVEGQGDPGIWEARERIREVLGLSQGKIEPPLEASTLSLQRFKMIILLALALLTLAVYSVLAWLIFKTYF